MVMTECSVKKLGKQTDMEALQLFCRSTCTTSAKYFITYAVLIGCIKDKFTQSHQSNHVVAIEVQNNIICLASFVINQSKICKIDLLHQQDNALIVLSGDNAFHKGSNFLYSNILRHKETLLVVRVCFIHQHVKCMKNISFCKLGHIICDPL